MPAIVAMSRTGGGKTHPAYSKGALNRAAFPGGPRRLDATGFAAGAFNFLRTNLWISCGFQRTLRIPGWLAYILTAVGGNLFR